MRKITLYDGKRGDKVNIGGRNKDEKKSVALRGANCKSKKLNKQPKSI